MLFLLTAFILYYLNAGVGWWVVYWLMIVILVLKEVK